MAVIDSIKKLRAEYHQQVDRHFDYMRFLDVCSTHTFKECTKRVQDSSKRLQSLDQQINDLIDDSRVDILELVKQ